MKTYGLALLASAGLTLGACGGGTNSSTTNSAVGEPQGTVGANSSNIGPNGGANANIGASGNSSIGAPGNQLGRGNTVVGSSPSDAADGDSMSNTSGQMIK